MQRSSVRRRLGGHSQIASLAGGLPNLPELLAHHWIAVGLQGRADSQQQLPGGGGTACARGLALDLMGRAQGGGPAQEPLLLVRRDGMECGSGCDVFPPGAIHWQPIQPNRIGSRLLGKSTTVFARPGRSVAASRTDASESARVAPSTVWVWRARSQLRKTKGPMDVLMKTCSTWRVISRFPCRASQGLTCAKDWISTFDHETACTPCAGSRQHPARRTRGCRKWRRS